MKLFVLAIVMFAMLTFNDVTDKVSLAEFRPGSWLMVGVSMVL